MLNLYGGSAVPGGGGGHLVTVPQGVVGDRLPWGGERQWRRGVLPTTCFSVHCMCFRVVQGSIVAHNALCHLTAFPKSLSWLPTGSTVTYSPSNGDRVPATVISASEGEGKIGLQGGGGGRGTPPKEGGVWQWGSCDKTLGKVPITSKRGC